MTAMQPENRIIIRFGLLLAYAGILAWLSLMPHPPRVPVEFLSWDKAQHAGAYFFLAFLAGRALMSLTFSRRQALYVACITAFFYGLVLETAQGTLSAGRTMDLFDVTANACGVAAFFLIICLFPRLMGRDNAP